LRALLALGSFLFTVRLLFRAPLDFFFTITRGKPCKPPTSIGQSGRTQ
jgi:hypothetical protein